MPKSILSPLCGRIAAVVCVAVSIASVDGSVLSYPGLVETQVSPVGAPFQASSGMAVTADGRVFVLRQSGKVDVISGGTVTQALDLSSEIGSISGQLGLTGITLAPDFETSGDLFLYYTAPSGGGGSGGRVARFTMATPTTIDPTGVVLLNTTPALDVLHSGGALGFGADGNLYIGVGDRQNLSAPQTLTSQLGKILRITPNGAIPLDNPYAGAVDGSQYVWSYGLRNPYHMAFQPGTDLHFVNDVGQDLFEEINSLARTQTPNAAQNFGWPVQEGPGGGPTYVDPVYSYAHADFPGSCGANGAGTITGGAFANPNGPGFGGALQDDYFYADFCHGTIRSWDPNTPATPAVLFASGISSPVDLIISPGGALYYLTLAGAVFKVETAVPEPGTLLLTAAGLLALGAYRRRRKR